MVGGPRPLAGRVRDPREGHRAPWPHPPDRGACGSHRAAAGHLDRTYGQGPMAGERDGRGPRGSDARCPDAGGPVAGYWTGRAHTGSPHPGDSAAPVGDLLGHCLDAARDRGRCASDWAHRKTGARAGRGPARGRPRRGGRALGDAPGDRDDDAGCLHGELRPRPFPLRGAENPRLRGDDRGRDHRRRPRAGDRRPPGAGGTTPSCPHPLFCRR